MNTNKNNGLSTRTKIWMGVGAYILTAGLSDVANASAPHNLSQEIASQISTSGDTFTSSEMLQAATPTDDKDDKKDGKDDKKDEGGESGQGGEGGEG